MIEPNLAADRHRNNLTAAVQQLRARMSVQAVSLADRLARINGTYVKSQRDKGLNAAVDRMLGNIAGTVDDDSDIDIGRAEKRRALFVIGESGSGKTTAIQRMLAKRPEFQPYADDYGREVLPAISFEAPKPLTLKLLARTGLEAAGYPVVGDRQENLMWNLFKTQIKERSILFVHIDEMQHVIKGTGPNEIQNISDVVKSLLQIKDWPVHAIFSGVPSLAKFLQHDERQLRNRCEVVTFDRISFPGSAADIRKIALHIIKSDAEMEADANLFRDDEFAHRLIHAANGAFGTAIQIVRAAVGYAIYGGREKVGLSDFASVYSGFTGCPVAKNVFLADRWTEIAPELALSSLIEQYDREEAAARKGGRK